MKILIYILACILMGVACSLNLSWIPSLITIITGLITGLISGIIASLLVSWIIFYGQYNKSITKYRIEKIKKATNDLIRNFNNLDKKRSLQNRNRLSLSVIINGCIESFGPYLKSNEKKYYPGLIDKESDTEPGKPSDAWQKYNKYIKSVKEEINQFSHVILTSIFHQKDLTIMRDFLIKIETIIEGLDALRLVEYDKGLKIIEYDGDSLLLLEPSNGISLDELEYVKKHYNELEGIWKKWLKLVDNKSI